MDSLLEASQHLYTPQEVDSEQPARIPPEDLRPLRQVLQWSRDFIAQPHPQLGRSGAVCPFVKPSMKESLFFLTVCQLNNPADAAEIYRKVLVYRDVFRLLSQQSEELAKLMTILILLPDITNDVADVLMEPLHKQLKTQLLEDNMLIGQFYPTCRIPGTWNSDFYPLQSPVPMFVIRTFIETDWRFLKGIAEWEEMYIEQFGPPKTPTGV